MIGMRRKREERGLSPWSYKEMRRPDFMLIYGNEVVKQQASDGCSYCIILTT
jgi:hypothetical protein